jgi:hypothetical protein
MDFKGPLCVLMLDTRNAWLREAQSHVEILDNTKDLPRYKPGGIDPVGLSGSLLIFVSVGPKVSKRRETSNSHFLPTQSLHVPQDGSSLPFYVTNVDGLLDNASSNVIDNLISSDESKINKNKLYMEICKLIL